MDRKTADQAMAIGRNRWFILFNGLEYVLQGVLGEPGGIVPGVSTYPREPPPLYYTPQGGSLALSISPSPASNLIKQRLHAW